MAPTGGDIVEDPVFGYHLRFTPRGEVLRIEVWVRPQGGVNVAHFHPATEERFMVEEGEVTFMADGDKIVATPGDDPVVVRPGIRHTFRNTGGTEAYIVTEAEGGKLDELQGFLEAAAALSREGKMSGFGIPKPGGILRAVEFAERYRDTVVVTSKTFPPPALQPALLGPLARLERNRRERAA